PPRSDQNQEPRLILLLAPLRTCVAACAASWRVRRRSEARILLNQLWEVDRQRSSVAQSSNWFAGIREGGLQAVAVIVDTREWEQKSILSESARSSAVQQREQAE